MRESIGGAMMLRMFMVVIVIFVVFLCVSANFARAFRVKNGVISIIEEYEGINSKSIPLVESYINRMGYSCFEDGQGYDFDSYSEVTNYVLKRKENQKHGDRKKFNGNKDVIYDVQVCVDWNFPVIDAFGTWKFVGKTELIKDAVE